MKMLKTADMLKALMETHELNITQLSKISDVSQYILAKILVGEQRGSSITWVKIFKGLNESVFDET